MDVDIKRLARELNLSTATVSKALRDSHEISVATKKRVVEMAQKLNYHPNPFASGLRARKSKTIAVVIPEIDNNFFSLAIKGIEKIAQQKDYHVLIYLTHEDVENEKSFIKHLQGGRVDGVLISVSRQTSDVSHLAELKERNIPIVFFDRVCQLPEAPIVTTDDFESGYKATQHLIEQGCKRIAYLQIAKNLSIGKNRLDGYLKALKDNHIAFDKSWIVTGKATAEENYIILKKLLTRKKRPEGLFSSVESLAITTYYVCKDLGIQIPKDIMLVGFSNLTVASLLSPSLTTVTQPAYEIGAEAATILFQLIRKKSHLPSYQPLILSSTLIRRDSTKK